MIRIRTLNGTLYALAVGAALTVGTVQAFATSGPQQSARICDEKTCDNMCGGFGFCDSSGRCICQ